MNRSIVTDPLCVVGETSGQDLMALSDTPYSPCNCSQKIPSLSGNPGTN